MAGNPKAFQSNAFQNNAFQTGDVVPPVVIDEGQHSAGHGEHDWEGYKARRRQLEDEADRQRIEARDLQDRLDKAAEDLARKAKAKRESKAKRALQERIDRFTRELAEAELQITQTLLEIRRLEQEAEMLIALDRRRRLLLLATLM